MRSCEPRLPARARSFALTAGRPDFGLLLGRDGEG